MEYLINASPMSAGFRTLRFGDIVGNGIKPMGPSRKGVAGAVSASRLRSSVIDSKGHVAWYKSARRLHHEDDVENVPKSH